MWGFSVQNHKKFKIENIFDIIHGVPQGSILGPLLFSLYINDFRNCLQFSEAIMFADDTTLLFKSKSMENLKDMVNSDLSSASEWLAENKLSLNVTKTNFMCFDLSRTKCSQFDFIIDGEKISINSNLKLDVPNNPIIPYICGDGIH